MNNLPHLYNEPDITIYYFREIPIPFFVFQGQPIWVLLTMCISKYIFCNSLLYLYYLNFIYSLLTLLEYSFLKLNFTVQLISSSLLLQENIPSILRIKPVLFIFCNGSFFTIVFLYLAVYLSYFLVFYFVCLFLLMLHYFM